MASNRNQRRREQREAVKKGLSSDDLQARRLVHRRLRKRVRLALLLTTLIGFGCLRLFHQQLIGPLQHFWVRMALVLVLLAPALLVWMISLGQLKDTK